MNSFSSHLIIPAFFKSVVLTNLFDKYLLEMNQPSEIEIQIFFLLKRLNRFDVGNRNLVGRLIRPK